MKNLLLKIQNLPERKRKIIFWILIVILTLFLLSLYIKNIQKTLKSTDLSKTKEELQFPSLGEELREIPKIEIPKIEMPEIDEEMLRGLECATGETPN
jgi:hypothetical protein